MHTIQTQILSRTDRMTTTIMAFVASEIKRSKILFEEIVKWAFHHGVSKGECKA